MQKQLGKGSNVLPILLLVLGSLAINMATDFIPVHKKLEIDIVDLTPLFDPPITLCGVGAEVVLAPRSKVLHQKKHSYQEMLYRYDGDRIVVRLPTTISAHQAELLIYAYDIAKQDGIREPAVLQGIIWQESKAGGLPGHKVSGDEYGLSVGKRYYGVGQIKVAAAKDVFKKFPNSFPGFYEKGKYLKSDEEIIALLITDDKFNIRVASKYFWMMGHNTYRHKIRPLNFAITAYNQGAEGAREVDYNHWPYTVAVNKHRKTFLNEFNQENNLN